jgi:hypothetical protein
MRLPQDNTIYNAAGGGVTRGYKCNKCRQERKVGHPFAEAAPTTPPRKRKKK